MAIEYFCCYHSYLEAMEQLNDAERGRLFTACLTYSKTGEAPELRGNERFVFPAFRSQIDRDNANYEEKCRKQSANARKRWDAAASDGMPNDANNAKKKEKANTKTNTIPPLPPDGGKPPEPERPEVDVSCLSPPRPCVPYDAIMELYNKTCRSLPRINEMTDARKKAVRSRFTKGYTMQDFEALFNKAEASSFLNGTNGRGWSANFDWLIKEANMVKTLEGNYDNKATRGRKEPIPSWVAGSLEQEAVKRMMATAGVGSGLTDCAEKQNKT